jgi:hypothetical protein
MVSIRKAYYYLFYKLYKFSEASPSRWLSDWKAELSIDVLIFFCLFSFFIYYKIFCNRYIHLSESNWDVWVPAIVIGLFNYFIFHHHNQWKRIVKEFDRLPKRKNIIGGWIVFGVVLLIIANLVYAFYLMSQIDWKQYR